jgi:alkyl sulfatase BDS1-like metallo-beta-lactamase superfamily hydrolase
MKNRSWKDVALGAALTLGLLLLLLLVRGGHRWLTIGLRGAGLDPSIPVELRVPPSIHPELAEHSKIYEKRIYDVGGHVRCAVGYGLANVIFVEGDQGIVVVDTGESIEQATEVLAELRTRTQKPIVGVVLTHHHADHMLGTSVFVSADDAASGKIPVVAHESLVRSYVDENGITAELQAVRSLHMYGLALGPKDREGSNDGIGPFIGRGASGFVAPNRTFTDRLELTLGGVRMDLRWVPSEAQSEVAIYLPDWKLLLSAEVVQDHTFPNVYTIRGARYRDPVAWVRSLDLLRGFDAQTMVLAHGPPVEGRDEVARVLRQYRDEIQFVHDQAVRRMNQGLTPDEIAETVRLPAHLADDKPWGRPYYGTVEHSVRNVYGGYEGWFHGDPVDLAPTPFFERARRTVAMMGGRDVVLGEARRAYLLGDAQWAAELVGPLIRLNPSDMDARHLKAAAFRKLGYAQINASWRNYYLVSAMELDDQIPSAIYLHYARKMLARAIAGLPADAQLALLPSRLRAEDTLDVERVVAVRYVDANLDFTLHLRRGVLEIVSGAPTSPAFRLEVTREAMGAVLGGGAIDDRLDGGGVTVVGDLAQARQFFGWFETPFAKKPEVVVR